MFESIINFFRSPRMGDPIKSAEKAKRKAEKRSRGVVFDEADVRAAMAEDVKKIFQESENRNTLEHIADNAVEGEFLHNTNWMGIENLGPHLSPIGDDPIHTVEVWQKRRHSTDELLCSFESTNYIYTEWVQAISETMWHTKSKTLKDIHGRKYFVGNMCESRVKVSYHD